MRGGDGEEGEDMMISYCRVHFLGWQIVIKCNPFTVFLVSLECVKGVFYCPRPRPKYRSRKNQVESKKTKVLSL